MWALKRITKLISISSCHLLRALRRPGGEKCQATIAGYINRMRVYIVMGRLQEARKDLEIFSRRFPCESRHMPEIDEIRNLLTNHKEYQT
ncbi:MAG: hypothetical protein ACK4VN_13990 [Bacteroidales bacterium]